MSDQIPTKQPLPLRGDVDLRPAFRHRCETAQRVADLVIEALAIIAGLPHFARRPSPVLNRLRSCYRNGRLFGDRFASAAYLFETRVLKRHYSDQEREIGATAAEKLAEAARLAWTLRRESLDEPTWTSLHGELAELNHFGGAIPSVREVLGVALGKTGANFDNT